MFCSEIPVFLREHNSGTYRTDVYFISKQLADLPVFLLTPVLFISIFYYMVMGQLSTPVEQFLVCLLTIVLISQAAIGMGYFASCISPRYALFFFDYHN